MHGNVYSHLKASICFMLFAPVCAQPKYRVKFNQIACIHYFLRSVVMSNVSYTKPVLCYKIYPSIYIFNRDPLKSCRMFFFLQ